MVHREDFRMESYAQLEVVVTWLSVIFHPYQGRRHEVLIRGDGFRNTQTHLLQNFVSPRIWVTLV